MVPKHRCPHCNERGFGLCRVTGNLQESLGMRRMIRHARAVSPHPVRHARAVSPHAVIRSEMFFSLREIMIDSYLDQNKIVTQTSGVSAIALSPHSQLSLLSLRSLTQTLPRSLSSLKHSQFPMIDWR
eukprot:scaffold17740_cov76-Cyclotella_meneghiniana.AAC.2